MRPVILTIILLLCSACLFGQTSRSGDIEFHIDSLIDNMPGETPSGLYQQPGAASRATWRVIIQNILAGTYSVADSAASTLDYEVCQFTDTVATPDKMYYVLQRKTTATARFWGTFVFNPAPYRPALVIQCAHPLHDLNTGQVGL